MSIELLHHKINTPAQTFPDCSALLPPAPLCRIPAQAYFHFQKTDQYKLEAGKGLDGFMPDWIGEFYAYYQWYYNMPSSEVIQKIPVDFLEKAYSGLHDLELELAVKKVGEV